ncbi:hypothetical protein ElyMa_005037700 [Elysia marginata]|uniref:Uncharacterized protein n=1 Tax=Elysia marginata TaxID=1093978 RepID=A0AAV4JC86_9GAST|nr:hypothetical protein ElyMa_005037700 [Elysia marginata]
MALPTNIEKRSIQSASLLHTDKIFHRLSPVTHLSYRLSGARGYMKKEPFMSTKRRPVKLLGREPWTTSGFKSRVSTCRHRRQKSSQKRSIHDNYENDADQSKYIQYKRGWPGGCDSACWSLVSGR